MISTKTDFNSFLSTSRTEKQAFVHNEGYFFTDDFNINLFDYLSLSVDQIFTLSNTFFSLDHQIVVNEFLILHYLNSFNTFLNDFSLAWNILEEWQFLKPFNN